MAALVVAAGVEVGLRTTTLPTLARLLGTPLAVDGGDSPGAEPSSPVLLPPRATVQLRATRRVMRHWPFGDTCLRQALVSGHRIRRLGPVLHVGVMKADGEVRAHAWLVAGGMVIDPRRAVSAYLPLTAARAGDER